MIYILIYIFLYHMFYFHPAIFWFSHQPSCPFSRVLLIADAPPHGLEPSGDGFPNGDPEGRDPLEIVRNMTVHGITCYTVGCWDLMGFAGTFGTRDEKVPRCSKVFWWVEKLSPRESNSGYKIVQDYQPSTINPSNFFYPTDTSYNAKSYIINGNFRILKWRYVSTIFQAIFCGDIPWNLGLKNRPYIW